MCKLFYFWLLFLIYVMSISNNLIDIFGIFFFLLEKLCLIIFNNLFIFFFVYNIYL